MSIWCCNGCYPFVLYEKHGWNCETEEWWYFPSLFWNSNFFFLIFTGSNCGDILLVYCDCGMDGWNCDCGRVIFSWCLYSYGLFVNKAYWLFQPKKKKQKKNVI